MDNFECLQNQFEIIKVRMELYYSNYNKYIKFKCDVNKLSNYATSLEEILETEKDIELITETLHEKFKDIESIKLNIEFDSKEKSKLNDDITIMKRNFTNLDEMYEKKKKENTSKLVYKEIDYKGKCRNEEKQINSTVKEEINFSDGYNNWVDEDYYQLQLQLEMLDEKHKEFEGDKEAEKLIKEKKDEIAYILKSLQEETLKANQHLLETEVNVNECDQNIEKSNEQLRQAALYKNKKHGFQYPVIGATVGGAIGTIIPFFGNIGGAAAGAAVGMFISKQEKNAIKNIEPDKYK